MPFLLTSVLCSVLVSVLLKFGQRRGLDTTEAICWSYLAAAGLCAWLLDPALDGLQGHATPWLALGLLVVLLPGIFVLMAASVRSAGIVRTDIAQRLSLLVSLLAAFLWFGEQASAGKLCGLALGFVAIIAVLARPQAASTADTTSWRRFGLPLGVLLGYATIDILLKHVASTGVPLDAVLLVAFCGAFVLMVGVQWWRRRRGHRASLAAAGLGLLIGLCNFGNILFYLKAHRALPDSPAVVFASMNLGVVVLGTLVGAGLFGERLGRLNWLGIGLAVLAIMAIATSL